MKHKMNLPFEVGQLVEVRSFEAGYRGAWFRCKIRKINKKKGKRGHLLEYIDFTEEKLAWTMLYQVPFHHEAGMKGKHRELMVRPRYPPFITEKQMPRVSEITEVTVIGGDPWRVGDLVDWWTSDSYWSGRITQLLGDDEAQIDLTPPPLGEGSSYKALLKDLRPSLDWSPEHGWTVPTQEDDTGHLCARIIKPVNQVIDRTIQVEDLHNAGQETVSCQTSARLLFSSPVSSNSAEADAAKSRTDTEMPAGSLEKTVSKKRKHRQERSARLGPADHSTRKPSEVVADSGHNEADPAAAVSDAAKSRAATEMPACSVEKTVSKKRKHEQESARLGPADHSTSKPSKVVADSGHSEADPAATVSDAAKSIAATEMPACSLGKPVSEKWKNKQKRSPRPGPTDSSTNKPSMVVADSGHNGADPATAVSDAAQSRAATEMPACSMGKPVTKKWKNKQKRSPRPGPTDGSTRKPSMVVADSGHNGADPAVAVSDAANSRAATEMPACSLGKPVSKKWKNKQKRSPRRGLTDSSARKPSRVEADSGQNGAAVSDATKSRAATEVPARSLEPADHSTSKPSKVAADSGHNGAVPAAEIAQAELNLDSVLLPKGSDSMEAAIFELEEYLNKVKWLKKLLQCGISSSDAQVPQWEVVDEIS